MVTLEAVLQQASLASKPLALYLLAEDLVEVKTRIDPALLAGESKAVASYRKSEGALLTTSDGRWRRNLTSAKAITYADYLTCRCSRGWTWPCMFRPSRVLKGYYQCRPMSMECPAFG